MILSRRPLLLPGPRWRPLLASTAPQFHSGGVVGQSDEDKPSASTASTASTATAARSRRRRARRKRQAEAAGDPYLPPPPPCSFPEWEPRAFFGFELVHQSKKSGSRARVGRIHTPHGVIDTPGYVAVATNGALKYADHMVHGSQLQFCNSYHLLLQPGPEVIEACGGLHKFMNRDQPIITDSGGFQIFSLAYNTVHDELNMKARAKTERPGHSPTVLQVTEEGVTFRSYRDGTKVVLTPESTVAAQKAYGSDIIIPLDELPPYHLGREDLVKSVLLTHRWEARSLRAHLADPRQQAMYGVLHGGVDRELRQASVEYLRSLPFDGFAIGGSLGKDRDELIDLLRFLMPMVPANKPNHLLGVADVESIHRAVPLGVDTFDSCFPTRNARHGSVLCRASSTDAKTVGLGGAAGAFDFGIAQLALKKKEHATDLRPIDEQCQCYTCRNHSRAYLHHLVRAHEPMAATLLTIHNLQFMSDLMSQVRERILNDEI
jgi:queuine tRNA-ribosyltransferase